MRTPVVMALLVVALTAGAQEYKDAADEAEVQFTLGNQAYLKRDFRTAIAHWFASNRLAPNRNVVFNIGRAYEQLAQYVEAYRYYQTFSQYELTGAERIAVTGSLQRVSASVALLDVQSTPPGATLYVDRKDLGGYGTTPRVLALAPGVHRVILELAGHEPYVEEHVKLEVGQRTVVLGSPRRLTGRIVLGGQPAGASVRFEGPTGVTAATVPGPVELGPGRYRLVVTHEGYAPRELWADVAAQQEAALDVTLVRLTGTLVVQADERDALVLVDGKAAGFTPAVVDGVPSGRHEVSVVLEGFRTWTGAVEVVPDEKALVAAELMVSEDVAAASRTTESAQDAPASVSLLPDRELQAFGAQTLAQAVRGERGVFPSDDGTYEAIGVRGFSPFGQYGNRLAVQIDGHPMNDDWLGSSFVGYDLLSDLGALERIELVRGPGSVLYGTGAFFGVVNLVTHATAPRHPARIGLGSDSDGTIRASAGAGTSLGDDGGVWATGGGLYGQPSDFFSPAVAAEEGADGTAHDVGGFTSGSVLGRAWWRDLTLQWYFNQRNKGIQTGAFETVFGDSRAHSDDRRAFIELRYEPVLAAWAQLFTRLSYDHSFYRGTFPYPDDESGVLRETYTGNWVDAEARGVFRPADGLRVTAGADLQLHLGNDAEGSADNGGSYLAESHPFKVLSAYAIADYAPLDWLAASAGVRFDGWWIGGLRQGATVDDRFLSSVNPRLALVLHPSEGGTLKLLGGRAFRAPSIYELTYWDGGLTQIQSPDLDPEVVYTGEIEYSHRLPLGFIVTGAAFLNSISELIEQRGTGDEGDPLHYVNVAEDVWTVGGEVEVARELRRGWMASVQYSFQRTRKGSLDASDALENSPAHLAALKLIVPVARPELLLATRLVVESGRTDRNRESTRAAVLWDVALSGTVAPAHLRYAAGIKNLTDWRYGVPVGEDLRDAVLTQPGRTFFADLELYW